jgi:hypothetical protein
MMAEITAVAESTATEILTAFMKSYKYKTHTLKVLLGE